MWTFKKNIKISEVIAQLNEKYEWIDNMNIIYFLFDKRKVEFNKTCEENNLVDSSKILIIDE